MIVRWRDCSRAALWVDVEVCERIAKRIARVLMFLIVAFYPWTSVHALVRNAASRRRSRHDSTASSPAAEYTVLQ